VEMLIFYTIAILLSAYETNKDKQKCEKQSEIEPFDIRNWHQQYENNASCGQR
jgi:ABC-type methionine transport system ATPase subunit